MLRSIYLTMVSLLLSSLSTSCSTRSDSLEQSKGKSAKPSAPDEIGHAIYDAKLRDIMVELNRETIEHWPEELEHEHKAQRSKSTGIAFEEAGPMGEALAKAADGIPSSVAHLQMLVTDRRVFAEQATVLRDQARELSTAARQRNRARMKEVLCGIDSTCRACHDRFMDVAGPLSRL